MTNRERAMNILHYKSVDRLPAVHFGYWGELLKEWAEQGKIPKELAEGKEKLAQYDTEYNEAYEEAYAKLEEIKPVIYCGDLNVAHCEIDLKNPKTNRMSAGFTDQEREKMTELLNDNKIDTFRYFYPDAQGEYSWWSYRFKAREKNAGWRIDYFIVSDSLKDRLRDASIHQEIFGSDHCPVELVIE
mgnify:CR=1 FL=1